MAKFLGLFGGKTKYVDETETNPSTSTEESDSFYLSADEAKTLGNIDFMRQSQTIKHTFPKTKSSQGSEIVQEISALEKTKVTGNAKTSAKAKSESQPRETEVKSERRSADSSMDMFRQMAREIKK
jgi:hypothetical protein